MKVAALAGGVGGAKLLVGLAETLPPGALTAVVNTGDDAVIYDVHVSPDVDIVTYWLAGIADTERGWGLRGDTFNLVEGLERLGAESWFRLGDRDFATCLYRTARLRAGWSLGEVTRDVAASLGVATRVLPMSDDEVRTVVTTADGRRLGFQEYFVREATAPEVVDVTLAGIEAAAPAPGVIESLGDADVVVVCPSNPVLSVGPIVALPGVREALRAHPRVVAVTPIVRGAALKGPAARLLESLGGEASASGVARLYSDFCDVFVVDSSDPRECERVAASGMRAIALDTVMGDGAGSRRLAQELLAIDALGVA